MALKVNGEAHELLVQPQKTLLEVLREDLALTGTSTAASSASVEPAPC